MNVFDMYGKPSVKGIYRELADQINRGSTRTSPETIGDLTTTPPDRWNISCPEYSSLTSRYHHSRKTGGPGSTISCTLTVKSLPGSHTRLPSISKGMQRCLHWLLTSSKYPSHKHTRTFQQLVL